MRRGRLATLSKEGQKPITYPAMQVDPKLGASFILIPSRSVLLLLHHIPKELFLVAFHSTSSHSLTSTYTTRSTHCLPFPTTRLVRGDMLEGMSSGEPLRVRGCRCLQNAKSWFLNFSFLHLFCVICVGCLLMSAEVWGNIFWSLLDVGRLGLAFINSSAIILVRGEQVSSTLNYVNKS